MKSSNINISNVLAAKNRCKHCGKIPEDYYVIRKHRSPNTAGNLKEVSDWTIVFTKRMCSDFYLNFDFSPSHFTKINNFSFRWINSVCPRSNKNKGQYNYNGYIYCKCGKTRWAINDDENFSSGSKRKQISPLALNRKGKYFYPFKILYED